MNPEQNVPARLLLLSGGVFGACFLLPFSWHFDPMLQEHQHLSMQTSLMPFALGSSACSHCILWWPEHLPECFHVVTCPCTFCRVRGLDRQSWFFCRVLSPGLFSRGTAPRVFTVVEWGPSVPRAWQLPSSASTNKASHW